MFHIQKPGHTVVHAQKKPFAELSFHEWTMRALGMLFGDRQRTHQQRRVAQDYNYQSLQHIRGVSPRIAPPQHV